MTLSVEVIIASFDGGMDLILFVLNDARDLVFLDGTKYLLENFFKRDLA